MGWYNPGILLLSQVHLSCHNTCCLVKALREEDVCNLMLDTDEIKVMFNMVARGREEINHISKKAGKLPEDKVLPLVARN